MATNKNYESLMGPNWSASENDSEAGQKQRLLGAKAQLSDQNRLLGQAIRVGHEAENVAKDTKINLQGDTDKMERMRGNIMRIQGEVSFSDKMLDIIKRNESRNSLILYTVVALVVAGILLLLFFKILK